MARFKRLPSPITILMLVTILAAVATWILPSGKYDTLAFQNNSFILTTPAGETRLPFSQKVPDSLHIHMQAEKFSNGSIRKPLSVPGTYHRLPSVKQGFISILQAPIKGIYESIDIVLFLLLIGGFMNIFHESGALIQGLSYLSHKMKGRESWLIIILTFLFSFGGSSYGMSEEALVFYPVMVPLFLSAGYDLLVPLAVIFGGTQLGTLSSFSNPFSTIIASNAAGVSWTDGLYGRILMFFLSTGITIWYIANYANKIKKEPSKSIVLQTDGKVIIPYEVIENNSPAGKKPDNRSKLLLLVFLFTFVFMIYSVVAQGWWLTEMSTLFLGSSILMGIILRYKESFFVMKFIKGSETMLGVALIVGVARGVTIILNEGRISDTILYYSANAIQHLQPWIFISTLLILFIIFTLFISSSSGMAVLTMPIMGALAIMASVPGREIVNTYLFGMGIMGFMTPTGLILPSLALVNVSLKAWWRFIFPLLLMLLALCMVFVVIGVLIK